MADRFEDHRGVIQDLLGPVDCVTEIFTRKGAKRGNHVHHQTHQWTYVVSGLLRVVTQEQNGTIKDCTYGPRETTHEPPGVAHAWKALEDTYTLVFTIGPRSGENYESDTFREGISLI